MYSKINCVIQPIFGHSENDIIYEFFSNYLFENLQIPLTYNIVEVEYHCVFSSFLLIRKMMYGGPQ